MVTATKGKTITIASVVDVIGVLATDSFDGQIYFVDNNKTNGSTGQGTEELKTMVSKGDRLVWIVGPLECEVYAAIDDIVIDKQYCEPEKKTYEGTDISFWSGIVKQDLTVVPYTIKYKVGTRDEAIATNTSIYLVGKGT